jgi:hypothetical protein
MGYVVGIGFSIILAGVVSLLWVIGIDDMKENHPDYKGEDFLDWGLDEQDKNDIS